MENYVLHDMVRPIAQARDCVGRLVAISAPTAPALRDADEAQEIWEVVK